ncbi:MAG: DUF3450 domain-containing protein [Vibrio sp.]
MIAEYPYQFLGPPMLFLNNLKIKSTQTRKPLPLACLCSSLLLTGVAHADALDSARAIERQTNQAASETQSKINANADARQDMQTQIEQMKEQIENQTVYQKHLQSLVESQTQELEKSKQELSQIGQTREGIVPLMYRMLAGLEDLQSQGIPVKTQARAKRIDDLKALMSRADITEAEKFRRLLEAYQIEIDYGNKLSSYQQEIEIADGDVREVELLAVGKIALLARSQDHQSQWLWSAQDKTWQALSGDQIIQANKAFDVATGKSAPELIQVPLSVPVAAQSNSLAQTQAIAAIKLDALEEQAEGSEKQVPEADKTDENAQTDSTSEKAVEDKA